MPPKIIKTEADYVKAMAYLESLKSKESAPQTESEIELWSLLVKHYEGSRGGEEPVALSPNPPTQASERALVVKVDAEPLPTPEAGDPKAWQKAWQKVRQMEWASQRTRTWMFFGACALLVYLRLLYHGSFFPSFFEGEEAKSLDLAKATVDYAAFTHSWWQSLTGGATEYNKGYGLALAPFYMHYGYDVRIITYVLPVFFSIYCATFFTIYRKTYPKSSLLSFVLVALFSVLCLSLRRYKWHSITYLTAISVYVYFLPYFYGASTARRAKWLKVLSLFLFAFSTYFYFGCVIYALPFFGLIYYFNGRAQRRRELILLGVCGAAFLAMFDLSMKMNDLWEVRLYEELEYVFDDFTLRGLGDRWFATKSFFFTLDLSVPFLVLFVIGLVSSIRKMRRGDRFALVNTSLLLFLWALELSIQGLNNPDQLNWSMIPLLGVLLIGADEVLVALRDKLRWGAFIGALLVAVVGWHEMGHYLVINRDTPYQPFVQPRNTMAEAALMLMKIRDDDSGSVQYYLPDPSVPTAIGGFEYSVSLLRVDFKRALSKVILFKNEEDLREKLAAQPDKKLAVVYLSVGEIPAAKPPDPAIDPAEVPLLGQKPKIIHPYADIYGIEFMVREFRIPPGPAALALPMGKGWAALPRVSLK